MTIPSQAKEEVMAPKERQSTDDAPLLVDRPLGDPTDPRGTPSPSQRRDLRSMIVTASGLNALAGVWLILAPFVLDYGGGDPRWNDIAAGAIITLLALARLSGTYRASGLSWLNAFVGAWLVTSAFWLDASNTAAANDIVLGLAVFVLGLLSASAGDDRRRRQP